MGYAEAYRVRRERGGMGTGGHPETSSRAAAPAEIPKPWLPYPGMPAHGSLPVLSLCCPPGILPPRSAVLAVVIKQFTGADETGVPRARVVSMKTKFSSLEKLVL